MNKKEKTIYLDYASTTPVDPRVFKLIQPYFSQKFANPISLYSSGQVAHGVLEKSRKEIADLIGAKPEEIIFTSSATESNNLALKGIALANKGKHFILSPIEHACLIESARWLEKQGYKITYLKVDKDGLVSPEEVRRAIKKETILVSILQASNEIGTIQPIKEIGEICRERGVYFHTDATQSFTKLPINVQRLRVDLLSASSHKIYGPKGAAFLYLRQGIKIEPLLHGGGQEFNLRSSTVNLPAIVGLVEAAKLAEKERKKENERLLKLRDRLIKGVLENIPDSHLTGHPRKRLANHASFWFDSVEGEAVMLQLDLLGIALATGSACSSTSLKANQTLLALGLKAEETHGSLRITLGRWTKESEINYLLKVLPKVIYQLRKIAGYEKKVLFSRSN